MIDLTSFDPVTIVILMLATTVLVACFIAWIGVDLMRWGRHGGEVALIGLQFAALLFGAWINYKVYVSFTDSTGVSVSASFIHSVGAVLLAIAIYTTVRDEW